MRRRQPPAARAPLSLVEAAPLLVAPELARLRHLAGEIAALRADIALYRPSAHRRLVLEDRLRPKVGEMLALQARLYRRQS
jgi:hypothetical protein